MALNTIRVTIQIGDPEGERYVQVNAIVDTGTSYTSVPGSLLRRLGVRPHYRVVFILSDGRRIERDVGQTWKKIDGKSVVTRVVFGDENVEPLVGAYTLDGVRLMVDSVNEKLVPTPDLLMSSYDAIPKKSRSQSSRSASATALPVDSR